MRILHFSDTHEPARFDLSMIFDKRILGFCNSFLIRKNKYDQSRIDKLMAKIPEIKPDVIVFSGDAVSTSTPSEFEAAKKHFQCLRDSDIPVIFIPGNHDCYVKTEKCRQAMKDFYHFINQDKNYTGKPVLFSCKGVRICIIQCALPTSPVMSSGLLNEENREFLIRQANMENDMPLICAGHFPVLEQQPWRRKLYGAEDALKCLKKGSIALSLCGHIHNCYQKLDETGRGEVCCGSLTKHGTYHILDYNADSNAFESKICNIDEEK